MNFLVQLIVSTLAVLVTAYLLPGVYVEDFLTAMVVAIVLGFLNSFLKPLLILLALPAVVITFGLFLVVINTVIILLTDNFISGFEVSSFWWAVLFGIVQWVVTGIFNNIRARDEQAQ